MRVTQAHKKIFELPNVLEISKTASLTEMK
jgi:hypothetical protein